MMHDWFGIVLQTNFLGYILCFVGSVNLLMVIFGCSIFDSGNTDFGDSKIPNTTEIKTKPDGWETTSRGQDGNIWDISQREDDILIQEFERRIAFSKQQVHKLYFLHGCTQ
jgi:hypothetical protein